MLRGLYLSGKTPNACTSRRTRLQASVVQYKATSPGQLTNSTESFAKIAVAQVRRQKTRDMNHRRLISHTQISRHLYQAAKTSQPAAGSSSSSPKAAIQACKKLESGKRWDETQREKQAGSLGPAHSHLLTGFLLTSSGQRQEHRGGRRLMGPLLDTSSTTESWLGMVNRPARGSGKSPGHSRSVAAFPGPLSP